MLGDFNLCLRKKVSNLHKQYNEVLNIFNGKQLIKEITRETDTTQSCIDHIFTNNEKKISQAGVITTGISDHYITYCTRKSIIAPLGKHNTAKIRSLRNYSIDLLLNKLREVEWTNVTNCDNTNDAWENFRNIFIGILDLIAPLKEVRIKLRTEPWIDDNILQLIRERDKLLTQSNKNKGNKNLRHLFNQMRNKLQREVKKAKANYFQNKVEENQHDSKKLWGHLKTLKYNSKVKDRAKIVVESEGEKYFDSKKVSEIFKDYFTNVASNLVNKLPAAFNMFSTESMSFSTYYENKNVNLNSFILQPVTENFVYKELKNLNSKKSTG